MIFKGFFSFFSILFPNLQCDFFFPGGPCFFILLPTDLYYNIINVLFVNNCAILIGSVIGGWCSERGMCREEMTGRGNLTSNSRESLHNSMVYTNNIMVSSYIYQIDTLFDTNLTFYDCCNNISEKIYAKSPPSRMKKIC